MPSGDSVLGATERELSWTAVRPPILRTTVARW